jgi:hypothetical protein
MRGRTDLNDFSSKTRLSMENRLFRKIIAHGRVLPPSVPFRPTTGGLIPFPVRSYREDSRFTVQVVRQGEVDKGRDELGME